MKDVFISYLSRALNSYLALDPEYKIHLKKLHNKIVAIHLLPLDINFQLCFKENVIDIKMDKEIKADTVIQGTPLRLLHMILSSDKKSFFADDVSIQGNLELGQAVMDVFDQLQIDWEEYLSRCVGDIAAFKIGSLVRQLKSASKKTSSTLTQHVNEYIHEEINFFPPAEAVKDFFNDVDQLRMDTDRVEIKIKQLEKEFLKRSKL